jgi:hypothetical protein
MPHEYFPSMAWLAKRLGDRVPRVRHVMERIRGVFKASRAALRG